MKIIKLLIKYRWRIFFSFAFFIALIWVNYFAVSYSAVTSIHKHIMGLPEAKYGLFLGTPKFLPNGKVNNYYKNRISSTFELYHDQKIKKIIISADTSNKYQENEVGFIKQDLMEKGVLEEDFMYDFAGNSTWKSISFLEKELSSSHIILISQRFHLERAICIAKNKNLKVSGFIAKGEMSNRLWFREILARVKMRLDIMLK